MSSALPTAVSSSATASPAAPPATEAANTYGPLHGLTVLELGSTVAGPFCGRLLGDFGARVIKVEQPSGDPLRTMGEKVDGVSLYAASLLRNKSLLTLDLRQAEGRRIARELAVRSDIVVENFRPGSLEKWGLGYQELAALNPGLIMVRISGYGQSGPYRDRPGYGVIGEAVSGVREMTGDADRPPARVAVSMTDYLTGLYAAFGATMAVLARRESGRGQLVDAALYESAFSMMEPFVPAFAAQGTVPTRSGSRLPGSAPNNLYTTADGHFLLIAAMADAVFRRLAEVMEQSHLASDPRFASAVERTRHDAALDEQIGNWCAMHSLERLEAMLLAAEVPASRVYTLADIFADPHYQARGMLLRVPHAELGSVTLPGIVPNLSDTPGHIARSGGEAGRDTCTVLREMLDMDDATIARLAADGVIGLEKERA